MIYARQTLTYIKGKLHKSYCSKYKDTQTYL